MSSQEERAVDRRARQRRPLPRARRLARFEGLAALARQRLVYAALAAEMQGEVHALSMRTQTPAEWREQPVNTGRAR